MREVYPFPPSLHGSEDDEKTLILPGRTASGELASDWPDAQTVMARRSAVGTEAPPIASSLPVPPPPRLPEPPLAMPVAMVGEATKILDVNGMHQWIASAVGVTEFANGTAEVARPAPGPALAAPGFPPNPEIFALPPEVTESTTSDDATFLKLLRGAGVGLGLIIIVIGALALLKPDLALRFKAAIFPQPVAEPVVLAIEIPQGGGTDLYGPSLDETWVARLAASAAQAMQAGDREQALARYSELHTLIPDNEVYAGLVKTLSVKKGGQP